MIPWLSPAPPGDLRTGHRYRVQGKSSKTLDAGGAAGAGGDGSLGSLAARGRAARHREARHGLRTPAPPHLPAAGVLLKAAGGRVSLGTPAPGPHGPARPPARIEDAAPAGAQSPLPQPAGHSPRTAPRAHPGASTAWAGVGLSPPAWPVATTHPPSSGCPSSGPSVSPDSRTTHRRDDRIVRFIAPAPSSRRAQAWDEPGPPVRGVARDAGARLSTPPRPQTRRGGGG